MADSLTESCNDAMLIDKRCTFTSSGSNDRLIVYDMFIKSGSHCFRKLFAVLELSPVMLSVLAFTISPGRSIRNQTNCYRSC